MAKKTTGRRARTTRTTTRSATAKAEGPICTVPDCDKPVHLRGLCEEHWTDPKSAVRTLA